VKDGDNPFRRWTPNDCSYKTCDEAVSGCMTHTGCYKQECYCIQPPSGYIKGDRMCWEARCPSKYSCKYDTCKEAIEAGRRRTSCDFIECIRSRAGDGKYCFMDKCGPGPLIGPEQPPKDEAKNRKQDLTVGTGRFTYFKPSNIASYPEKPHGTTETEYPTGGSYAEYSDPQPKYMFNVSDPAPADEPGQDWKGFPKLGPYVNDATQNKISLSRFVEPVGKKTFEAFDYQAMYPDVLNKTENMTNDTPTGSIGGPVNLTEWEESMKSVGAKKQSNLYPMSYDEKGYVIPKPGWPDLNANASNATEQQQTATGSEGRS